MGTELDLLGAAERGAVIAPGTVPTNPAEAYLETLGNELSRRAMMYSLNAAAAILNPALSGRDAWCSVPWAKLTAPVVRAIMARYTGCPSTRNKMLAALKGVARAGWELRLIETDELMRMKAIKGDTGSREIAGRYVPPGEIAALLRACANDRSAAGARDAAMISLAASTGARRAEIAGVSAENLHQPEVGRFEVRIVGKGNKARTLFISGNAALALTDWLALRFAPGCNRSGPLFWAIRKGGTILPDSGLSTAALDKMLRKRVAQASVADVDWHDLRRSLASNLLDAGADIATVAGLLGHAQISTTLLYDRRGERAKIKASQLVSLPYYGRPKVEVM